MPPNPQIAAALQALGIPSLNPMQEAALSAAQDHPGILLLAPTGSGKTLAFLLPLLQRLDTTQSAVQALIIAPSRELALQIEQVFRGLQSGFKSACFYGGHDMQTEIRSLSPAPAVLVGTPGRILDHLNRKTIDLRHCVHLVLDEFDKSLEMGFEEDMAAILGHLPHLQHRVLTSATAAVDIPSFVGLNNPWKLDFLGEGTGSQLTILQVNAGKDKLQALFQLLCTLQAAQALIFCNHRESAERTSAFLVQQGLVSECFHGGLDQRQRESALCKFRNGSAPYLVCTDLAARGLDIPEMECVIHYQLPLSREAFVHRNGRTARMGHSGTAYMLLAPDEHLPAFIEEQTGIQELSPRAALPPPPRWTTLFIGAGKKEKINKADIAGFLSKTGALPAQDVGLIEVKDHMAFVAVPRSAAGALLKRIEGRKIKNKKIRFQRAR